MLIHEATNTLVSLHDEMYRKAAKIFANRLYDKLTESGILRDERIICSQTDGPVLLTKSSQADENFILWSLIPYLTAISGEKLINKEISFEEAATYRPDGGHNIGYASVIRPDVKKPVYFDSMKQWNGPCWNGMMQRFALQYIFFSDGWFILHCLKELVNNGKLKLPTQEQKKCLAS